MPQMRPPVSPMVSLPKEILEMVFDPSMVIERIRHDLKGETGPYIKHVDPKTGKECNSYDEGAIPVSYWLKNGQRDMNDQGVEAIVSMLNKYINRNSFFSNITEDEVYKIIKTISHNLNAMFASKYVEYEIDINRMSLIKEGLSDMIFLALKQSENATLMNSLTQLVSVSEVKESSPRRGFSLGDLSPFGGSK